MLARKIVGGEFDRRLGIRIALDGAVHARVELGDLSRQRAFDRRRQMARDDLDGGCKSFAEIAAELAAPVLERGRLAPARCTGRVRHFHQDVAADRLRQAGPFVFTPRRQRNVMKLNRSDGCFGHAPGVHTFAGSRAAACTGG